MKDYIAVDWGSTQLRGWLIRNGQCVETKQLPDGYYPPERTIAC